jgi:DNA invertase Pin-like site-specific DNA recombinase
MRIWLYYRLSRDEDDELNSLTNQRKIIYNYAVQQGYEIVGESFDDNVSGMHFNREGIDKIYEAVETGGIDAVLVKDLSRLGRHRTQTALFIDYLRENNVRVLSATENIDTFNENDDLIIGFKGLVNDFYARDGSRRVRTGYRQKQKDGIVLIAPFGYFKDKNTRRVVIVEEAAETVRLIFTLYTGGRGLKAIAKQLNEQGRKTPAMVQMELLNKRLPNTQDGILKKYLWDATMVKRILENEIYTGTLINHKSERNKINKTYRVVPESEQFRHDNFLPAIVTKDIWEQANFLIDRRRKDNIRAGHDQAIHRYAGLLKCGDCGRTFVGKRKTYRDGSSVVEYICTTYIRYGKEHCTAHTIREDTLDRLLETELLSTKKLYQNNWRALDQLIERWIPKANLAEGQIKKLKERLKILDDEIDAILLERIRDRDNAERYGRMIEKRQAETDSIHTRIGELENLSDTIRKKQATIKKDISMIDDILAADKISEAQLRLLIDHIEISETEAGLDVKIVIKAPFRTHIEEYDESGEVVDSTASLDFDFDRLAPLLFDDFSELPAEQEVS